MPILLQIVLSAVVVFLLAVAALQPAVAVLLPRRVFPCFVASGETEVRRVISGEGGAQPLRGTGHTLGALVGLFHGFLYRLWAFAAPDESAFAVFPPATGL